MGADVCQLLLLCRIDFNVGLFSVLADYETVVDLCVGADEEWAELLDLLQSVWSCETIAHADDGAFRVLSNGAEVRLVLVELRPDHGCPLSFTQKLRSNSNESSC